MVRWLHNFAQAQLGPDGVPQRVVGTLLGHQRASRGAPRHPAPKRILQRIAQATPLTEVLADIARMLEEQFPGTACAIWLQDAATHAPAAQAAPSLPESLRRELRVLPSQPTVGATEHTGSSAPAAQQSRYRPTAARWSKSRRRDTGCRPGSGLPLLPGILVGASRRSGSW